MPIEPPANQAAHDEYRRDNPVDRRKVIEQLEYKQRQRHPQPKLAEVLFRAREAHPKKTGNEASPTQQHPSREAKEDQRRGKCQAKDSTQGAQAFY